MERSRLSLILLSLASCCLLASECSYAVNAEPEVVPAVQHWTGADGTLSMPSPITIRFAPRDAKALNGIAGLLREDLASLGFPDSKCSRGRSRRQGR